MNMGKPVMKVMMIASINSTTPHRLFATGSHNFKGSTSPILLKTMFLRRRRTERENGEGERRGT